MNTPTFVFLAALGLAHSAMVDLSCKQIRSFVDGHNSRRLQLAQGKVPGQPAAENMHFIIWDEELAAKASKWASRNKFEHNPDRKINSGRFSTGENILWTASNNLDYKLDYDSVTAAWFIEYKDFKFGPLRQEDFSASAKKIGHYTQMAWADTTHVGCGVSDVVQNGYRNYYVVCNYGPGGNYLGRTPYKVSKTSNNKLFCGSYNCSKPYGNSCPK